MAKRAASVHIDHCPTDLQIQSKYSRSPVNFLSFWSLVTIKYTGHMPSLCDQFSLFSSSVHHYFYHKLYDIAKWDYCVIWSNIQELQHHWFVHYPFNILKVCTFTRFRLFLLTWNLNGNTSLSAKRWLLADVSCCGQRHSIKKT